MSITVVGTVALDTVETPFGRIENGLGGSATHFSVSASFFTSVNLVAVVGKDFPKEHIDFFHSRKINTEGIAVIEDGKTFRWEGRYDFDLNQAHTLATHLNVIEKHEYKVPKSFQNPGVLFLANIDPDQQRQVIAQSGKSKFIGLDTMNLWIDIKRTSVIETMKLVNLVTINEAEARALTNTANLVKAAKKIQSWGPQYVIIKRGEYGAMLFCKNQIFCASALPLEDVNDPTGAGDSFAGGVFGYLDRCHEITFDALKTAVICGSVMASFNVEKFSCDRLKEISYNDIQARFREFEELGQFEGMNL